MTEAASVYGDRDQTGRALPTASVSASVSSFDLSTPLNVTVQYGGHVYLVCRVQDVGNKSVNDAVVFLSFLAFGPFRSSRDSSGF